MIEDYQIVVAITLAKLQISVYEYLKYGWEPVGGVALSGGVYTQAMIKRRVESKLSMKIS